MIRHLVIFAREPGREAREKGLSSPRAASAASAASAAELFASFARGWIRAAAATGAHVSIAAPAEDILAWRRRLPGHDVGWISQRGSSFGGRLREAARAASASGEPVVFVGGDVPPDAAALGNAFEALEGGADAILAPSRDGGVSVLALSASDRDLLASVRSGSRTVFADLLAALSARGRRTAVLELISDVDRRRDLRRLFRSGLAVPTLPLTLIREALAAAPRPERPATSRTPRSLRLSGPSGLRAPPAAA